MASVTIPCLLIRWEWWDREVGNNGLANSCYGKMLSWFFIFTNCHISSFFTPPPQKALHFCFSIHRTTEVSSKKNFFSSLENLCPVTNKFMPANGFPSFLEIAAMLPTLPPLFMTYVWFEGQLLRDCWHYYFHCWWKAHIVCSEEEEEE